ncbi:hypothetical protein U6A24_01230 [Aquimarina gracilis]|uniref:Uncharacterized protein n=1 Tax=Aquimarina gracilis TaxID=874422 RepID=A0ABU5ZPM1_9FLAO|nr:hypothetical protein [Aquimarina gracilis]MEB3344060.1 hypothetical protein [Aquimarina gracilis]
MKYHEFFHIEIIHPYFSGLPKDLVLVPDNETKKRLNNLGCILRIDVGKIKVLAPIDQESNVFPVLGENDVFTFYIYPTSERIQEITDFSAIKKKNMISFTNLGQPVGNSELMSTQIEQKGVFQGFPSIANIVIAGNKIDTDIIGESARFKAIFKVKSIKWKYYFVSESQDSDVKLESRNEQIHFNEINIDQNTSDQIITSLQLNFPNSHIRAFESKEAIPYSSKPLKNIKLIQNGDVLINHLSNPQEQQQGIQIIKIK